MDSRLPASWVDLEFRLASPRGQIIIDATFAFGCEVVDIGGLFRLPAPLHEQIVNVMDYIDGPFEPERGNPYGAALCDALVRRSESLTREKRLLLRRFGMEPWPGFEAPGSEPG